MPTPTHADDAARLSATLAHAPAGDGVAIPVPRGVDPHLRALLVLDVCRIVDLLEPDHPGLRVGLFQGNELRDDLADADLAFVLYPAED